MASKRKLISAVIAVALAAAILMGGTFAWQSISQMALNEVYGHVNPGGRLHDDFTILQNDEKEPILTEEGTKQYDKNVYVENFTTLADDGVQIFARIRLDEYMETGLGAGEDDPEKNQATSLVYGATLGDTTSWTTHIPGNTDDPFHDYWDWTMAGENTETGELDAEETKGVWYMPTFNKNKDSLQADINGTFDAGFEDYEDYGLTKDHAVTADAVYDNDGDTEDVTSPVEGEDIKKVSETHYAKEIGDSTVITMADWLKLDTEKKVGPYWVWDTDGWAYWAAPIDPDSATGLFLDGIARTTKIINEDWYYGINVVAQFITADDLGRPLNGEAETGFYDPGEGGKNAPPSFEALQLLKTIGVKVNTEVATPEALNNALAIGGNITVNGTITSTTATSFGNANADFTWSTGGTLTGGVLTTAESAYAGVFINSEKDGPNEGDGANEATMNETTINTENTNYGLYIQAIDNDVTLNEVTVTAQNGGVYAEWSNGGKVTLNKVTVTAQSTHATYWVNAAVAVANGANMEINGGTYKGNYAAYIYSTGGTITINDGYFEGELACDAGELIIKGGRFTVDPTEFVPEGYEVTEIQIADGTQWTVSKKQA